MLARLDDPRIAVLGLAYKENTNSTKNAPSLALLRHLEPFRVSVFDPVVPGDIVPWAESAGSAMAAADGADALVIMTPWPEFGGLDVSKLAEAMAGRCIIDPYRILDGEAVSAAGLDYSSLGKPAPPALGPTETTC